MLKRCTKCGQVQDVEAFSRSNQTKDGRAGHCKACCKAYQDAYRTPERRIEATKRTKAWYVENKEKALEYGRAWHAANRERQNERRKIAWHAQPATERQIAAQQRYQENVEAYKARARAFVVANRDLVRTYCRNRKARVRNAEGVHTAAEVAQLFIDQKGRCANPFCGIDLHDGNRHLDHIEPLSRGGRNDIGNLRWLCAPCNLEKRAKTDKEWFEMLMAKHS